MGGAASGLASGAKGVLGGAAGGLGPVLGGVLGSSGGANGTGFAAPERVDLDNAVNSGQVNGATDAANNSLKAQNDLLAALQNQTALQEQQKIYDQTYGLSKELGHLNGAGNLGAVYNQSQGLAGQLAGANAVGNQSQALMDQRALAQQQQGTAQQYQNIANGVGPNPAQAMLNQATGQNVANQAALMAGQRGAGANVGLLARQAAMQGANTQQQAVGQGASMQAQQQIAGLSGLAQQQQAIGNTNQNVAGIAGQQLSAQQAQQQALAAQAANQVNQQMAAQQSAAAQANQQAGQLIGATNNANQAAQNEQSIMMGGLNQQNVNAVNSQNSVNAANAGLAGTSMQGQQGVIGGLMSGAGMGGKMATGAGGGAAAAGAIPAGAGGGAAAAGAIPAGAGGGEVRRMAYGGPPIAPATPIPPPMASPAPMGPTSSFGQFLQGWTPAGAAGNNIAQDAKFDSNSSGADAMKKGSAAVMGRIMAPGEKEPAQNGTMAGPDSSQMSNVMATAYKGGLAQGGGKVAAKSSSQKAVKKGNSYDNDKVPAMLSEHEIVLPRNVTMSKDPVSNSAKFVAAVLAKRKGKL